MSQATHTGTGRRRRRPSGEPPPLPRSTSLRGVIAALIATALAGGVLAAAYAKGVPPIDTTLLDAAAELRGGAIQTISEMLAWFAAPEGTMALRLALVVVLVVVARWRHLVLALVAFSVMDLFVRQLTVDLPAPAVGSVQPVDGYAFPAHPLAGLAITLGAMVYALAPAGNRRHRAFVAAGALAAAVLISKVILGETYPIAGTYSIVLGFAIAPVVFGVFAPDESFPVTYRRGGNAAHLALDGPRIAAVTAAMRDQLGMEVETVEAFGDEGSGGSTPLLMTLADGSKVFGKILATSHVRSDRWYRLARTVMYGRLEDETSFSSVLKLVEYEDYSLRLLADEGFRVAHTYGIVELTPQREYLLVTEFFAGADTLGHAEVTDAVIDDGLDLIRRLWDAGLAHRDVKPANLLSVDGHLQLIDTAVLEVRPSPWRQAVDLANMMLVLALRTDADRVYERATQRFTPEEISEAFASATGMAVPTELQRYLKEDPRDLVGRFKELAPPHAPVSIQRWSFRRIGLTAAVAAVAILIAVWAIDAFRILA
jgi:hypothetical protein